MFMHGGGPDAQVGRTPDVVMVSAPVEPTGPVAPTLANASNIRAISTCPFQLNTFHGKRRLVRLKHWFIRKLL